MRGLVHSPLNKVGLESGLARKASRDVQRHPRKIKPGCHRAAAHEAERVAPDMALQMEDALSGNVAEFSGFDGMESVLTCAKPVEHVVAGCVARASAP